jgi:hypothetical protein
MAKVTLGQFCSVFHANFGSAADRLYRTAYLRSKSNTTTSRYDRQLGLERRTISPTSPTFSQVRLAIRTD